MSKISTSDYLFDGLNNDEPDELDKLISLLKNNKKKCDEIFNYLDGLKCDASEKSVEKILQFAKEYRFKTRQKESTAI